jgi:hypothetical protein
MGSVLDVAALSRPQTRSMSPGLFRLAPARLTENVVLVSCGMGRRLNYEGYGSEKYSTNSRFPSAAILVSLQLSDVSAVTGIEKGEDRMRVCFSCR